MGASAPAAPLPQFENDIPGAPEPGPTSNQRVTVPVDEDEEGHHAHEDEISPELEELLQADPRAGLSTGEADKRLGDFGRNEIPEKKTNPVVKFIRYVF